MIAVTLGIGDDYKNLALHASEAIRKNTGLKTLILDGSHFASSGLKYPHHLKLRIFDLVSDDEVMFFDSDMVCLNPWNPQRFAKPDALVAVAERLHSMVIKACRDWEIPVHEYFNAGLMILNRNCHHDWLRETERFVLANPGVPPYDPYDQTPLNITRHRLGLKLELLDRRYNWVGFGAGELCYEVPVFLAHRVNADNYFTKFMNIDFFEGRYKPPFRWNIQVNEDAMNRLKNQTLCLRGGHRETQLRLNSDGTIGPPYYPGIGRYWFVHNKPDGLALAIASETELLREFTQVDDHEWQSIQELQPEAFDLAVPKNLAV